MKTVHISASRQYDVLIGAGLLHEAGARIRAVDGMDVPYLVGSLAGDDTALLIMRDTESALDFTEEIKEMLR